MNKENYDRQVLTAYLLGTLPEAEEERFDELSITDDDFADALKSAENELVDTYARNELSGAESERFETFYLASPLRREKVNFAKAFQVFAEKNIVSRKETFSAEESNSKQRFAEIFSALNIFRNPKAVLQWGFAAVILILAVFGGWIFVKNMLSGNPPDNLQAGQENLPKTKQNSQILSEANLLTNSNTGSEIAGTGEKQPAPPPKKEQSQTPPVIEKNARKSQDKTAPQKTDTAPPPRKVSIASFILTPPLRGNNQLQTISVSPKTDYAAMRLELESDDYAVYRVVLVDRSNGKNLWQSGKVKAGKSGEDKYLKIQFPAKLLKPQIYSLSVSGVSSDGAIENISDYSFRVVR